MGYDLGVDLGTTFTAAAVARGGSVTMADLGQRVESIPSVVLVRDDGVVLTGDAAHRRAAAEPARVAREFKRRLGDPAPLVLGGAPHSAAALLAMVLRDVVGAVTRREGGPPERVLLTHPANWGPYKRELFDSVPHLADLDGPGISLCTEPEAAAAHYAASARLAPGDVVAVYDFGGGTFDATVLRATDDGFAILGVPEGVEGLGGIDFDQAVFSHVDRVLDGRPAALDPADPAAAAALVRLRNECVLAKEGLSVDVEVMIPVSLPGMVTEVRLTRAELEEMMRPSISATVAALHRALVSADVEPADVSTVLLVGGSSRIPLVAQLVSAELGRPTAVDAHPKHAIAMGAARLAARTGAPELDRTAALPAVAPAVVLPPPVLPDRVSEPTVVVDRYPAAEVGAAPEPERRRRRLLPLLAAVAALLVAGGVTALLLLGGAPAAPAATGEAPVASPPLVTATTGAVAPTSSPDPPPTSSPAAAPRRSTPTTTVPVRTTAPTTRARPADPTTTSAPVDPPADPQPDGDGGTGPGGPPEQGAADIPDRQGDTADG